MNRALAVLVGLSAGTTVLTGLFPDAGPAYVAAVLLLSAGKARVILLDYLGLCRARSFRGGFMAFLIVFLALAFGLYLAG